MAILNTEYKLRINTFFAPMAQENRKKQPEVYFQFRPFRYAFSRCKIRTGRRKKVTPNLLFLGDGPNMEILRGALGQEWQPARCDWTILFEVQRLACPYELITLLESLKNKRLFLVAVTPLAYSDDFHRSMENQILPFLPESCDYLGLRLIPGAMEPESLLFLMPLVQKIGHADKLPRIRQAYVSSQPHPTAEDVTLLREAMKEAFSSAQKPRHDCR